ncbi:hypothetical protein, conserved [Babesia bigemina]|uniref:Uncharacterized protein n=1 Tax=Babesia bigemina TaxID=5866 RepID=A0A061DDS7_BABBI|nr:hypothetical protein, conserved [Babesia bigemina]CDR96535.1 hypothetical protein, conserved [Babesia bigemina]|eukprot:XP_012768721.1 hypothetical protein, conserved [Babesia bigemina]
MSDGHVTFRCELVSDFPMALYGVKVTLWYNDYLSKEKYQRYYSRCKEERDIVERQTVEALDTGKSELFEELATAVHEASEAIENFEQEAQKLALSTRSGATESTQQETWAADTWAAFPEQDEGEVEDLATHHANKIADRPDAAASAGWPSKPTTQPDKLVSSVMSHQRNASFEGSLSLRESKPKANISSDHAGNRVDIDHWGATQPAHRAIKNEHTAGGYVGDDYDLCNYETTGSSYRDYFDGKHIGSYVPGFGKEAYGTEEPCVYKEEPTAGATEHRRVDKKHGIRSQYTADGLDGENGTEGTSRQRVPDAADKEFTQMAYGTNRRRTSIHEHFEDSYNITHESQRAPAPSHHESPYATYCDLLERCIAISDGYDLARQLKQLTLSDKIALCRSILEGGDKAATKADVPPPQKIKSATKPLHVDVTSMITRAAEDERGRDWEVPEPLWRVQDDGGISSYLGNYIVNGGHLFEGIHFTAYLSMRPFRDSTQVEVSTEVVRKLQNMDIYTALRGPGADAVRIVARSATTLTFICEPETWTHTLPSLAVSIVESDGTNREVLVKLPIGPFSFFEPADIPAKKIERIIENNAKVGFYTIHKAFVSRTKLHMHDLLAAMEKYFAITKTNTRQTLAAVDLNGQVLVATLRNRGDAVLLDVWSPNVKTLDSACTYIKEIAAALGADTDPKLALRSLRTMSVFPLEFEQITRSNPSSARSRPAAGGGGSRTGGVARPNIPGAFSGGAAPA